MRRAVGVIVLGLLMALFCLAIGGLTGCLDEEEEVSSPTVKCKRVVGTGLSETRVYYCHDFTTNTCFYIARTGGFLEVPCASHPFVEEVEK